MAEINLSGIDRSNSNENAVAEAASLILNARKKGSTWEYVGDKISVGVDRSGTMYPHGYFWHYKIKGWYYTDDNGDKITDDANFNREEMIIAVNDFEINGIKYNKTVDILTIRNGIRACTFRNSGGIYAFEFGTDEEYLSLHSLNDIVILDTDKNKYYFVWDEEKYTFVQLPEIDDFEISVSSDEKEIVYNQIKIGVSKYTSDFGKGMNNYGGVVYSIIYNNRQIFYPLVRIIIDKIKEYLVENNCLWKGFRVVAAIELTDGSILKTSNIVDYTDNFFTNKFNKTINKYNYQSFVLSSNSYDADVLIENRAFGYRDNNNNMYNAYIAFENVKVNFDKNFYNILDNWIKADLIQSVSVYITEPKDFMNEKELSILGNISFVSKDGTGYHAISCYTPYNNKEAYRADIPYYKIGELDIKRKKTAFEVEARFLKDVVSKKPLLIEQDLSKKYVSHVNANYNGMIHKCNVRNIINIKDLIKGYNPNVRTGISGSGLRQYEYGCIYVDFKIKQKWYRYRLDSSKSLVSQSVLNGDWSHVYTIVNPRIEFSTMDIKEANLIISDHNGNFKIFKKLDLKMSPFTNSLVVFPVIDFNTDAVYIVSRNHDVMEHEHEISITDGCKIGTLNPSIFNKYFYEFNFYDCPLNFNVLRSVLNSLKSPTYTIEQNFDTIYYEDTNRLQLSATENPFIYPAERSYRFGDANNKVIGCESAVVGTSDAKFGMLPLHVFTKNGLWMMETGQGDIAYISQHLLENINCFDNHKLIHRVLGGVVFGAIDGVYFVSGNKIQKISDKLEGRVVLQDIDGIFRRLNNIPQNAVVTTDDPANVYIHNISKKIDNIMQDYFTDKSFCIHDKIENELLFIEPTRRCIFVLQLADMSWTMRSDVLVNSDFGYGTTGDWGCFNDYFEMDNKYILVKKEKFKDSHVAIHYFYSLRETIASKLGTTNINNNVVVFASAVIMMNQYMKIEHIIARFNQITNTEFDSHIFLVGSRDGIEWKVLNHSFGKITKSMSGQEMRRCFTSARYFQFVYVRVERGKQNTALRKDSYFERFTFDISNSDAEGKIR
jgi:hypothetical protein